MFVDLCILYFYTYNLPWNSEAVSLGPLPKSPCSLLYLRLAAHIGMSILLQGCPVLELKDLLYSSYIQHVIYQMHLFPHLINTGVSTTTGEVRNC